MNLTLTNEQVDLLLSELEWQAWQMAALLAGFPDSNAKEVRGLRTRLHNLKALAADIRQQRDPS